MKQQLKSKRGNALVLVVMLFMTISILALAVLGVAANENRLVLTEEKIDQAYYTARAVVDGTAQWISHNYNARDAMELVIPDRDNLGEENAFTSDNELDGKPYELKVWRDSISPDMVHIEAVATYQGVSSSAKMVLLETVSGITVFEHAIFTFEGFTGITPSSSHMIHGSVATNAPSIPDQLNTDGPKEINVGLEYELIEPPSYVTSLEKESITIGNNGDTTITENMNLQSLVLNNNATLNITNVDTFGNPKDIHIAIETLDMGNKASIVPSDDHGGRIYLYVTGNIIDKNNSFNVEGDQSKPIIYLIYSGESNITIRGDSNMNLFIYAPDITVHYGGNTDLYGAVMVGNFGLNGNVDVYYRMADLEDSPFSNLEIAEKKVTVSNQTWINN